MKAEPEQVNSQGGLGEPIIKLNEMKLLIFYLFDWKNGNFVWLIHKCIFTYTLWTELGVVIRLHRGETQEVLVSDLASSTV